MNEVRWEGFTHAEIYERTQRGPGRGASLAVESAWSDTESLIAGIEDRLVTAVAQTGAGWAGAAADAARAGLTPLGSWAADAAGDARLTAAGVVAQGEQAAWLRSAMPSPTAPLWDEPSGRPPSDPLYLLQDTRALEQRGADDAAQAVHLMNTYTNNSYENTRFMDYWTFPPPVTVETAAAGVGPAGGTGGAPGGVAPPGGPATGAGGSAGLPLPPVAVGGGGATGVASAPGAGRGGIPGTGGVPGPVATGVRPVVPGRLPAGPPGPSWRDVVPGGGPLPPPPVVDGGDPARSGTGPRSGGGELPGRVGSPGDGPGRGIPAAGIPAAGAPAAGAEAAARSAGARSAASPGVYPPMMGGAGARPDREHRRPDYLLDDGDAFADDRWFTPPVIGGDDPPPRDAAPRAGRMGP